MSSNAHGAARRGLIFILSSPSGAGKTTLANLLLKDDPAISLSISVTTRARRQSEVEGIHYRFVGKDRFEEMRDQGDLLEWAEVHGNYYATPRAPVEEALRQGRDILFDIDWQGTRQVCEKLRDDVASVFILPPSVAELRSRLERRAEDSAQIIAERLANAAQEISHWSEYDYVLVNTDVAESLVALKAILKAERASRGGARPTAHEASEAARHRRDNQPAIDGFISGLLAEF